MTETLNLRRPSPQMRLEQPKDFVGGRSHKSDQNTSDAVMAQRGKQKDGLDDFPTPPWGTRALCEHVLGSFPLKTWTVLEPAAGRGYMSSTLAEYFGSVTVSDVASYGYQGPLRNFIDPAYPADAYADNSFDWVITNPPFKHGMEFVHRGLQVARVGVAMLCRTVFVESKGRYEGLYRDTPPWAFAPFVERLPMVEGRIDRAASSATSYAWFVWVRGGAERTDTRVIWIPPCRARLEFDSDYPQGAGQ